MDTRQVMGMITAGAIYLVAAGTLFGVVVWVTAKSKLDAAQRRTILITMAVMELLGLAAWLYVIADLQHAFGSGVG